MLRISFVLQYFLTLLFLVCQNRNKGPRKLVKNQRGEHLNFVDLLLVSIAFTIFLAGELVCRRTGLFWNLANFKSAGPRAARAGSQLYFIYRCAVCSLAVTPSE